MSIETMIKNILDGNITEAQSDFNELVSEAVDSRLEEMKSDIFSEAKKEKKDDDEEEDKEKMEEEKEDDEKSEDDDDNKDEDDD